MPCSRCTWSAPRTCWQSGVRDEIWAPQEWDSHRRIFCGGVERQVKMSVVCLRKDLQNLLTTESKFLDNLCYLRMHSYNLKEKNSAVLPCSLQSQCSDSAVPCFGQEYGWKTSPGIPPPALSAVPRRAFSFLCTRQKRSEPKMVVV